MLARDAEAVLPHPRILDAEPLQDGVYPGRVLHPAQAPGTLDPDLRLPVRDVLDEQVDAEDEWAEKKRQREAVIVTERHELERKIEEAKRAQNEVK